jgi:hypothetical protein
LITEFSLTGVDQTKAFNKWSRYMEQMPARPRRISR